MPHHARPFAFSRALATAAVLASLGALPIFSEAFAQAPAPVKRRPVAPKTPTLVPDAAPVAPADPTKPESPSATPSAAAPAQRPGTASTAAQRDVPKVGPYLERIEPQSWILKAYIRLNSDRPDQTDAAPGTSADGKTALVPRITPFKFTKIAVVFPGIESSASSECRLKRIEGTLRIDDQIVDQQTKVMDSALYHSGVKLVRLETPDAPSPQEKTAREVSIEYTIPMVCSSTRYDEDAAEKVPWPTGPWPVEAGSTLTPQLFVDMYLDEHTMPLPYNEEANKILQGFIGSALRVARVSNPKDVPPARLAKLLTRQIWQDIQISGTGRVGRARTGELVGLDIQPPAQTITEKRGDEHDVTALAAAVFRKAGLPTRTVIGYDMYAKENVAFLREEKASRDLRSWVEFALYDEAKNTINWIPIDIARLRKASSRPGDINRPWKYFGTHDELNSMLPFAFQFHPPTDVVAYRAPGFWGWYVEPVAPAHALQAIRFDATKQSNRGGDEDKNGKDKNKKDDKKSRGRY